MMPFLLGVPGKLKTLLDRLTATRAANLDNLDAAVSTSAKGIKSLQRDFYTSGALSTGSGTDAKYADFTISSVNGNKTWIHAQFRQHDTTPGAYGETARVINSTTIRLSTWESTATNIEAYCTIIEYD